MKRKMLAMLTAGAIVLSCGYGVAAEEILDTTAGLFTPPVAEVGITENTSEDTDILLDEVLAEMPEESKSETAVDESEAESDAEKSAESTEDSSAEESAGNNEDEFSVESIEITEDAEEPIKLATAYGYDQYGNLIFESDSTTLDLSGRTDLVELHCEGFSLTSLNVSGCTALETLYCSWSGLTSLDLSNCTALTYLDCSGNSLTSLNLSQCTSLTYLDCNFCDLDSLDLSDCISLTYLDCSGNWMTSLDLSHCTALTELHCKANFNLTSLVLSYCTALTYLDCNYCKLDFLDFSHCTALTYLDCSLNYNLTSLDLSRCTALTELHCSSNSLTSLDPSYCTALTYLDCSLNNLTSLDLSRCTALTELHCSCNNLASLDLSRCTALATLSCYSNSLTSLDLSRCTALTEVDCETQARDIDAQNIVSTADGRYEYNLAALLGKTNISKVTSIYALSSSGESIDAALSSNGIVTFINKPGEKIVYCYNVGLASAPDTAMDVTLNITGNIVEDCTHTWDGGTVTTAATSTTDEVTTYKCTKCGESVSVSLKAVSFVYNGKKQAVTPIIRDSTGAEITVATSIVYGSADSASVTYSGPPVNSGNYTVSISVLGKYNLVWHRKFVVKPAMIDPLMSSITDSSFIYDGTTKLTGIRIVDYNHNILKSGTDYKISYSPDNVNAGTVKVTVTGIGNYQGSKTSSFRIVPQSITSGQVVLSSASYAYDGKKHQPTVTVKDKDGKTVASKCYTVTYSGTGKKPGTYTVTVKFSGNYQGTVKKTYSVNLAGTSIKSLTASSKGFTVKWKKASKTMNGYQIQYSTSKSFSSKSTKTVKKYTTTSKSITGLKGKKKYYVRIRTYKTISGKKYYSAWSPVKKVTTKK